MIDFKNIIPFDILIKNTNIFDIAKQEISKNHNPREILNMIENKNCLGFAIKAYQALLEDPINYIDAIYYFNQSYNYKYNKASIYLMDILTLFMNHSLKEKKLAKDDFDKFSKNHFLMVYNSSNYFKEAKI